jgi:hypothetical protein
MFSARLRRAGYSLNTHSAPLHSASAVRAQSPVRHALKALIRPLVEES